MFDLRAAGRSASRFPRLMRRPGAALWLLDIEPWLWLVATLCGFGITSALSSDRWVTLVIDGCVLAAAAGAAAWRWPVRARGLQRHLEERLRAAGLDPAALRRQTFVEAAGDRSPQSARYWRERYVRFMEDPSGAGKRILVYGFGSFVVLLQAAALAHVLYADSHSSAMVLLVDGAVAILDAIAITDLNGARRPLAHGLRSAAASYPSRRLGSRVSNLPSIPLALLAITFFGLGLVFARSHAWRAGTFLAGFLTLTWSSRKDLVGLLSPLERITSPLTPAYIAACRGLWHVGRLLKACLTVVVVLGLPVALVFSGHGAPPATRRAAQSWADLLIVLWGLQLALGLVWRDWPRPSKVHVVSAAQVYSNVADGAIATRVTRMLWGLGFVLAIWLIAGG